jgi:hypothetical protein
MPQGKRPQTSLQRCPPPWAAASAAACRQSGSRARVAPAPLHDGAIQAARLGGHVIRDCVVQHEAQRCRRVCWRQDLLQGRLCPSLQPGSRAARGARCTTAHVGRPRCAAWRLLLCRPTTRPAHPRDPGLDGAGHVSGEAEHASVRARSGMPITRWHASNCKRECTCGVAAICHTLAAHCHTGVWPKAP